MHRVEPAALPPDNRAELMVRATDLFLKILAPDCLSQAALGIGHARNHVVITWHGRTGGRWISLAAAAADGDLEAAAREITRHETQLHLVQDHIGT